MDKKINLEHTIKVVVAESLGSGVTTDKYVRTGNSFFKSVHIEPKKGDEHVSLNGAVRSGRNVNKERSSETMKEEEQIDEAGGVNTKKAAKQKPLTDKEKEALKPYGEFAKDMTPILGTIRQAGRTAEAGKETAKEFEKGNYWNAAKGAAYTAGQGVLTGVSAVGDVLTATGVGAPAVVAAKGLIKGAPKAISSLASTIKGVVAGSKAEKAAEVATKAPAAATAKVTPAAVAPEPPKVDTSIMGNLDKLKIKSPNVTQKDVNIGAASNANQPPKIKKPEAVEPAPAPQKSTKDNKTANDQETFDYKQQGNLKLKPKRDQADIPPAPDKNAALEKIFKKKPESVEAPANVNKKPISTKDVGKDKPKFDEPANVNVKKPSNDNVIKTSPTPAVAPKPVAPVAAPKPVAPAPAVAPKPVAPAPAVAPRKATDAEPAIRKATEPASVAKAKPVKKPGRGGFIPPLSFPNMPAAKGIPVGAGGSAPDVSDFVHRAGPRKGDRFAALTRNEEYNLQDAEEIKRKSRKAQIIRKIIDEQKKKKRDTSTVDLHPKLKNQEPDQN